MELEKLSNKQLYAYVRNDSLPHEMRNALTTEFNRRDFSIQYVDDLAIDFEKSGTHFNQAGLSNKSKLLIMSFPWIIPMQAILANKHIATGNKKKWEQHWFYVTSGIAIWLIILLTVCRFFLYNKI